MSEILLIGGGGYVGTAMAAYLMGNKNRISIIDNFSYEHQITNQGLYTNPNVKYEFLDYCKQIDLEKICKKANEVDAIVLLAGLVGDPITKKYPLQSNQVNKIGMKNLIERLSKNSNKTKHLIFISTCSNYGMMPDHTLADEGSELLPLSLYAKAKVGIEKLVLEKTSAGLINGTVLRFATAFGLSHRMRFDLTVNQFTREIALGNELLVFDADTWRPYCHVNDFARLVEMIIQSDESLTKGQIFNAGGDNNNFTKRGLIELLSTKLNVENVSFKENGGDPRNYRVSFRKVKDILNFEPKYSVEDGIDEILGAIQSGFFQTNVDNNNIYGNYKLIERDG